MDTSFIGKKGATQLDDLAGKKSLDFLVFRNFIKNFLSLYPTISYILWSIFELEVKKFEIHILEKWRPIFFA